MSYKIISNGTNVQSSVVEVIVDTRTDMQNVPTTFGVGSSALVLEDSSAWMLSNKKNWCEL